MNTKSHRKICACCGKGYEAKNIRGTYCSTSCRVKANRAKCVTVTQKAPIVVLAEEKELAEVNEKIVHIDNQCDELLKEETLLAKRQIQYQQEQSVKKKKIDVLLGQRAKYAVLHGKYQRGGEMTKTIGKLVKDNPDAPWIVVGTSFIEDALGNKLRYFNFTKEIDDIDKEIAKIRGPIIARFPMASCWPLSPAEKIIELKAHKTDLILRRGELEQKIQRLKYSKELPQLKDSEGFVSAKDLKNAVFTGRINFSNDLGKLLGGLEKNRCAITLTGVQGSGKTYFSFDLMSNFLKAGFQVAYFSCEEGITELTQEKLNLYGLSEEENCKIREEASLEDIRRFARNFDVIIIDSWGKLRADISEFDKLRNDFPATIFISIFQLTSGGQMRGGTMAAFDAGVNISTFIHLNKRYAECKKNRYGRTGIIYSIDQRKIIDKLPVD